MPRHSDIYGGGDEVNKSTVNRILIKLLLIFIVITIYFYFQHPIEYRCTNLKAVVPIGDMALVIDDIRISDRDQEKLNRSGYEIPWIYGKIWEANLPGNWTEKLFNIVEFYTRTSRTKEKADFCILGTLVYPAEVRNHINPDNIDSRNCNVFNKFGVNILQGYVSNGCTRTSGDNYCSLHCHGTFNLDNLNSKLTLFITDRITNKTSYIYFTPQWEKERNLKRSVSWSKRIDPAEPVSRYIFNMKRNNTQEALEYVMPGLRKKFEIPPLDNSFQEAEIRYTVEWKDSLTGYAGAYKITAEAGRFLNEERTDFEAVSDEKLVFYVVKNDRDGHYYITRVHQPYTPIQARIEKE